MRENQGWYAPRLATVLWIENLDHVYGPDSPTDQAYPHTQVRESL